ncbi:hypothetical protein [Chryseobacterium populi]|uniref:Uncharacterized protein n=1 Tax=Chryseobacterium populi TaxID=1144316 RepID=J3CDA4_9FLAO|nr:hypothetical protein [Chryseobacterium populi]EJL69339.1 hypothetical protein PMI13_03306 [Chryseobacterium populi]
MKKIIAFSLLHHTAEDTFEKVNRRKLLLGSVLMATYLYDRQKLVI